MRKFLEILSYLYLLSVSACQVSLPEPFGSPPRLVLYLMIPLGFVYILHQQRVRPATLSLQLVVLFMLWSFATWFWSYSQELTLNTSYQFLKNLIPLLFIYEFLRTQSSVVKGLAFFSAGTYMIAASILYNYLRGINAYGIPDRYTGLYFDPNEVGIILAIQATIAIYLSVKASELLGRWRVLFTWLPVVGLIGAVMTGSRTAVAVWAVPIVYALYLMKDNAEWKSKLKVAFVLAMGAALVMLTRQPLSKQFDRLFSITTSLATDNLTGRIPIWQAGIEKFMERPLLGVGAGAYRAAIESSFAVGAGGQSKPAHNSTLSLLTESGLIGFGIFVSILIAIGAGLARGDKDLRKLWAVVLIAWLVGSSAITMEFNEPTWVLILLALLSAAAARDVVPAASLRAASSLPQKLDPAEKPAG